MVTHTPTTIDDQHMTGEGSSTEKNGSRRRPGKIFGDVGKLKQERKFMKGGEEPKKSIFLKKKHDNA